MAEAHGSSGMPHPNYVVVESFEPLPGEDPETAVWREVRHGLNSMNLLVDQKLGGENERGEEEWIANEVLMVRLSDPNTIRANLLVICATYGWSYDDTKTRLWLPTAETQTA